MPCQRWRLCHPHKQLQHNSSASRGDSGDRHFISDLLTSCWWTWLLSGSCTSDPHLHTGYTGDVMDVLSLPEGTRFMLLSSTLRLPCNPL
ncbi:hypothetical protein CRENBAI_008672 [Crenichthys baileyi]|uniref:Uncharacterized protein n=1 Tax=Crenichthys baileyi TaxID=28760 RepID=A0AAV9RRZ2_9TELE